MNIFDVSEINVPAVLFVVLCIFMIQDYLTRVPSVLYFVKWIKHTKHKIALKILPKPFTTIPYHDWPEAILDSKHSIEFRAKLLQKYINHPETTLDDISVIAYSFEDYKAEEHALIFDQIKRARKILNRNKRFGYGAQDDTPTHNQKTETVKTETVK